MMFMKKSVCLLILLIGSFIGVFSQQEQKLVAECTVVFDLIIEDPTANPQVVKSLNGTTKMLYIKGNRSRTDLLSPAFIQTNIFSARADTVIVLRELGNSKYLSYLNSRKIAEQNRKYQGMVFTPTQDTKIVLGYECKKVIAKLPDGSTYKVYYTSTIIPSNREFEPQFKSLPGFVLEYETLSEDGKTKVNYSASKINFAPVPASRFEVPKVGYRVL
ncbi:MAG: hypothetical protein JWQ96_134 [Segetibacter sp.]|nr:hypothetical protein [Segetibacter sp.]